MSVLTSAPETRGLGRRGEQACTGAPSLDGVVLALQPHMRVMRLRRRA